jgi:hypothetical protein
MRLKRPVSVSQISNRTYPVKSRGEPVATFDGNVPERVYHGILGKLSTKIYRVGALQRVTTTSHDSAMT